MARTVSGLLLSPPAQKAKALSSSPADEEQRQTVAGLQCAYGSVVWRLNGAFVVAVQKASAPLPANEGRRQGVAGLHWLAHSGWPTAYRSLARRARPCSHHCFNHGVQGSLLASQGSAQRVREGHLPCAVTSLRPGMSLGASAGGPPVRAGTCSRVSGSARWHRRDRRAYA